MTFLSIFFHASGLQNLIPDHGIGMKAEDIPKIFARFERVAVPGQFSGHRLGLYIVGQIIDAHQGRIDVSTRLGVGSQFTVWLPIAESKPGEAA